MFKFDYIDNQAHATTAFKAAMAKLQVLGQNITELIDCSEVRPFVFTRIHRLVKNNSNLLGYTHRSSFQLPHQIPSLVL